MEKKLTFSTALRGERIEVRVGIVSDVHCRIEIAQL